MRIVLLVFVLVTAPTAAFFLWAWAVKIKQERKLAGTLPEWQDMPLTWLAIAGLVFTIIGMSCHSGRVPASLRSCLIFTPHAQRKKAAVGAITSTMTSKTMRMGFSALRQAATPPPSPSR